jgi:hypothetical protein
LEGITATLPGLDVQLNAYAVFVTESPPHLTGVLGGLTRSIPGHGRPGFLVGALETTAATAEAWIPVLEAVETPSEAAGRLLAWARFEDEFRVEPPQLAAAPRPKLQRIAAALRASADVDLRVEGDMADVEATAVKWHFPRDDGGRLALATIVGLEPLEPAPRPDRRVRWLSVAGPGKRRDPAALTVRIEELISANLSHDWSETRWRWHRASQAIPLDERWAIGDQPAARQILAALDEGDVAGAIAAAEVDVEPSVERLLAGRPATFSTRDLTATWAPRCAQELAAAAPWLLATAAAAVRPGQALRLFGLGGVNIVRKPGVFLGNDRGRAALRVEFSGSSARLPAERWQRPIELDLVRAGLVDPAEIPGKPEASSIVSM